MATRTTSFITRELRELQGVTVVESDPYWVIEVIVLETYLVSGPVDAVVMSWVILQQPAKPKTAFAVRAVLNKEFTEREKGLLDAYDNLRGGDFREFHDHGLLIGAPKDLRKMCETFVVKFDVRNLEPARKQWQELVDQR